MARCKISQQFRRSNGAACLKSEAKRYMPTKILCPKCHGQRTTSCPACVFGTRSVVGITMSTCKQCNGSGQRRCDVCGGAAEVEPDTLQQFTRAEHSADIVCNLAPHHPLAGAQDLEIAAAQLSSTSGGARAYSAKGLPPGSYLPALEKPR